MLRRQAPALVLVLGALLARPAAADEVLADGIAAQVGSDVVLVSEVLEMVAPNERRMRAAGAPESEIAKLRADGLETMIEWRLIEKTVRDANLYASDAEVDQTIAAIAQENGLTTDQLRRSVASQDMTYDDYRAQIKRELERRKVINAMVASRVHVDEADVKALYQERFGNQPQGGTDVHLRQLLVPAGKDAGRSVEESCRIVGELRDRIEKGESFEDLAKQYSAVAPERGGDIGWLHEASMASWMTALIQPLKDGEVSTVVTLPFGCTIIQMAERKEYVPVTYEQAKAKLTEEAFDRKVAKEYRAWIDERRSKTYIERRGYFADAAGFAKGGSAAAPTTPELPATP